MTEPTDEAGRLVLLGDIVLYKPNTPESGLQFGIIGSIVPLCNGYPEYWVYDSVYGDLSVCFRILKVFPERLPEVTTLQNTRTRLLRIYKDIGNLK